MKLIEIIIISLLIGVFVNVCIRNLYWKKFLTNIESFSKNLPILALIGRIIIRIGNCIKCFTFWFSLIFFSIFFIIKENYFLYNIFNILIATIFTTALSSIGNLFFKKIIKSTNNFKDEK